MLSLQVFRIYTLVPRNYIFSGEIEQIQDFDLCDLW